MMNLLQRILQTWRPTRVAHSQPGNYDPDPDPANLLNIFQQISADSSAGSSRPVG